MASEGGRHGALRASFGKAGQNETGSHFHALFSGLSLTGAIQILEGESDESSIYLGGPQVDEVFVEVLLVHGGAAATHRGQLLCGQQLGLVYGLCALEGQLVGRGGCRGGPIVTVDLHMTAQMTL